MGFVRINVYVSEFSTESTTTEDESAGPEGSTTESTTSSSTTEEDGGEDGGGATPEGTTTESTTSSLTTEKEGASSTTDPTDTEESGTRLHMHNSFRHINVTLCNFGLIIMLFYTENKSARGWYGGSGAF